MPRMPAQAQNPALSRHIEGLQALEKNDLAAAEQAFQESMGLDPRAPQPLLGLADLALRKNNSKRGLGLAGQRRSKLAPQNALVYQAIGRYHFAAGQHSKAVEALKKAQQLDPDSALIPIDLGEIYMQGLRRPDEAAAAYRRALSIDPQHAGAHYGLGTALSAAGKLADAEAEYKSAATLAPDNPLPGQSLGRLYLQQGQTDKALAAFDTVLRVTPNFVPALLDKGDIYLGKRDLKRALDEFQRAVKVSPNYDMAQLKLGMAYQGLGRSTEAEKVYLTAIEINPNLALAYNNLAWMAAQTPARSKQAISWAEKAVSLSPNEAEFYDTLGWAYYRAGSLEQAKNSLQKALAKGARSADVQYHLGLVWMGLKNNQEAKAAFLKALSIQKNHAEAKAALAKLN